MDPEMMAMMGFGGYVYSLCISGLQRLRLDFLRFGGSKK